MNIKEIKEMINLMNENGLVELEIEKDGMRVRLKKTTSGTEAFSGPIVVERERVAEAGKKGAAEPLEKISVKTIEIRAPMVGTFYRAPAPGARPFVEVGSALQTGEQVAIVEVMKLMNSIKTPVKGIVRQILAENDTMVKMGQTLMIIEPA